MSQIAPFYIGQEVVCIESGKKNRTIKGQKYTVLSIFQCKKCGEWYIGFAPIEPSETNLISTCVCGHSWKPNTRNYSGRAVRFRAYIPPMETITFEKIAEQNPVSVN